MPSQKTCYKVVLASPSDVHEERDIVKDVIENINITEKTNTTGLMLEILCWEEDSYTAFHPLGPQGIIDKVLRIDASDIFIGIFNTRFGTPTHDSDSGTEHELKQAIASYNTKRKPEIKLYFKKPMANLDDIDYPQYQKVKALKDWAKKQGVIGIFDNVDEFKEAIWIELQKYINEVRNNPSVPASIPAPTALFSYTPPKPQARFTGMEGKLKEFASALAGHNFISIEGLGGIGKTQFAAKCIEVNFNGADVVWFPCEAGSTLDSLITASGYPDVIKGQDKTDLARYAGYLSLIERDSKIIFLDNFHNVSGGSFEEFFDYAKERIKNTKIIILTRGHHAPPFKKIELHGLENDAPVYARKFITAFYSQVTIIDASLTALCNELHGHPLAIELAVQLLSYGETSEGIVKKISRGGKEVEKLSSALLNLIFDHPSSSSAEKELIVKFAVFRGEATKDAFDAIIGKDASEALHGLIDKHIIEHTGNIYSLHPLVKEFCYRKLSEHDKKDAHYKASSYLAGKRGVAFDLSLESEIYYHLSNSLHWSEAADLLFEKGPDFVAMGYANALKDMIGEVKSAGFDMAEFHIYLGDIAQIKGNWKEASGYFESAFSFDGAAQSTIADAYIKYGEILFRQGELKESLKYFEDAYEMCRKIDHLKGLARSLNDIGLVDQNFGNLSLAAEKLVEALDIREKIGDKSDIAISFNNIGNILNAQGDLNSALNKYVESLKIRREIGDKSGIADSLNSIGSVFHAQDDLTGALKKYEESLKIEHEIGYKSGIASSLNFIGNVLHAQGDLSGALKKYEESLKIVQEIGYKSGIAASFNDIGNILYGQGDLAGALKKHEESLKIQEAIGDKSGIASSLNNIGTIFNDQGDLAGALKKHEESLKIQEAIGNKSGIANSHHNIGSVYYKKKKFSLAFHHIFTAFGMQKRHGYSTRSSTYISDIRGELGLKDFKTYAKAAVEGLDNELRPYVNIDEFTMDKTIKHDKHKPGRNKPCPCNSGKKYKKCCGLTT